MIKFHLDSQPSCASGTQICYYYNNAWDCEIKLGSFSYFPIHFQQSEYMQMIEISRYRKNIYLLLHLKL